MIEGDVMENRLPEAIISSSFFIPLSQEFCRTLKDKLPKGAAFIKYASQKDTVNQMTIVPSKGLQNTPIKIYVHDLAKEDWLFKYPATFGSSSLDKCTEKLEAIEIAEETKVPSLLQYAILLQYWGPKNPNTESEKTPVNIVNLPEVTSNITNLFKKFPQRIGKILQKCFSLSAPPKYFSYFDNNLNITHLAGDYYLFQCKSLALVTSQQLKYLSEYQASVEEIRVNQNPDLDIIFAALESPQPNLIFNCSFFTYDMDRLEKAMIATKEAGKEIKSITFEIDKGKTGFCLETDAEINRFLTIFQNMRISRLVYHATSGDDNGNFFEKIFLQLLLTNKTVQHIEATPRGNAELLIIWDFVRQNNRFLSFTSRADKGGDDRDVFNLSLIENINRVCEANARACLPIQTAISSREDFGIQFFEGQIENLLKGDEKCWWVLTMFVAKMKDSTFGKEISQRLIDEYLQIEKKYLQQEYKKPGNRLRAQIEQASRYFGQDIRQRLFAELEKLEAAQKQPLATSNDGGIILDMDKIQEDRKSFGW
jgi:hypothetical protein